MMKMQLFLVQNDDDHRQALAALRKLIDKNDPATVAQRKAQALLIGDYEARRWPKKATKPVDVLRFVMEDRRLTPADLGAVLGSRSRVTEILNGSRKLSLEMIRRLRAAYRIPADLLIGEDDGTKGRASKRTRPVRRAA